MNYIIARIKGQGYTYEAVANAIGMSRPTLANRIYGKIPWTIDEARKLCQFLEVDTGIFF